MILMLKIKNIINCNDTSKNLISLNQQLRVQQLALHNKLITPTVAELLNTVQQRDIQSPKTSVTTESLSPTCCIPLCLRKRRLRRDIVKSNNINE
ncbi:hypothetical protein HCN44_010945 [Aphidius gifuensis]|uniref:Uncharacterized protein n=1 Tax=Aphidius gifuensis TaxID=684658 RepID=A0A835CWI1_APHGI|nr:hypothetical protein HCN44_010945 [Aphidius gifuensis]